MTKRETPLFQLGGAIVTVSTHSYIGPVILVTNKRNRLYLEIAISTWRICNYFGRFVTELEKLFGTHYWSFITVIWPTIVTIWSTFVTKQSRSYFIEHLFGYTNWLIVEAPRLVLAPSMP